MPYSVLYSVGSLELNRGDMSSVTVCKPGHM